MIVILCLGKTRVWVIYNPVVSFDYSIRNILSTVNFPMSDGHCVLIKKKKYIYESSIKIVLCFN